MKRDEYEWDVRENVALVVYAKTGEVFLRVWRDADGTWTYHYDEGFAFGYGPCMRTFTFIDLEKAMAHFDERQASIERAKEDRHRAAEKYQASIAAFEASKKLRQENKWWRKWFK